MLPVVSPAQGGGGHESGLRTKSRTFWHVWWWRGRWGEGGWSCALRMSPTTALGGVRKMSLELAPAGCAHLAGTCDGRVRSPIPLRSPRTNLVAGLPGTGDFAGMFVCKGGGVEGGMVMRCPHVSPSDTTRSETTWSASAALPDEGRHAMFKVGTPCFPGFFRPSDLPGTICR